MNVNIDLLYNKVARIEGSSTVMLPDDLTVTFKSPSYRLPELVVNVKNGKKEEQRKVKGQPLDLSDFLFAGVIEMEVYLIAQGKAVKKWVVAPIIINEIERGFELVDEIEDLKARVSDLERKTQIIM